MMAVFVADYQVVKYQLFVQTRVWAAVFNSQEKPMPATGLNPLVLEFVRAVASGQRHASKAVLCSLVKGAAMVKILVHLLRLLVIV